MKWFKKECIDWCHICGKANYNQFVMTDTEEIKGKESIFLRICKECVYEAAKALESSHVYETKDLL